MKAVYVEIEDALHKELKIAAAGLGITLRALMLKALLRELETIKGETTC